MSAKSPSPPPSPRTSSVRLSLYNISQAIVGIQRIRKSKSIVSSSGPEPITHAALSGTLFQKKVHVLRVDEFICESGVDAPKLLRACRSTLLEQAQKMGANALVDEEWQASIIPPKNPMGDPYKVEIRYEANAIQTDKEDPRKPVALDRAKGVPGLMTITKRAQ